MARTEAAEAAASLGLKACPMFQPIQFAVCERKNAPPLVEIMACWSARRALNASVRPKPG
ncbi:MAG: hypothetical protein ACRD27_09770 [Terracidiphilus sp.]